MENFSSLPPEEEAQFRVFEERMQGAAKTATLTGVGAALAMLIISLLVIFSNWGNAKPIGVPPEAAPAAPPAAAPTAAPAAAAPAAAAPAPAAATAPTQ